MADQSRAPWGSDTKVSMPVPLNPGDVLLDMGGGFAFTRDGLQHNVTRSDVQEISAPQFRPMET